MLPYQPLEMIPLSTNKFEEMLSEIEKAKSAFLQEAEELDTEENLLFKRQIKNLTRQIQQELKAMIAQSFPLSQIEDAAKKALLRLGSSADNLLKSSASYHSRKIEVKQSLDQLTAKMQQCSISFDSFTLPSSKGAITEENVEESTTPAELDSLLFNLDRERSLMIDQMLNIRLMATAVDAISYPFDQAWELAAKGASAVCKVNPTLEKKCKKAKENVRDFIVSNTQLDVLTKDHQDFMLSDAWRKEEIYAIPREDTYQYHYDMLTLGMVATTCATFGLARRFLKREPAFVREIPLKKLEKAYKKRFKEVKNSPFLKNSYLNFDIDHEALRSYYNFIFTTVQRKDGALHVFIEQLWKYSPSPDTKTAGIVYDAFSHLKQMAQKKGVKEIYLQWQPYNDQLFKIAQKRLTHIGNFPHPKAYLKPEIEWITEWGYNELIAKKIYSGEKYPVFKLTLSD